MKEWLTPKEIAELGAAGLPATARNVNAVAERQGWREQTGRARRSEGRGGGWEYHYTLLPGEAQARLLMVHGAPANANSGRTDSRDGIWSRFERLSAAQKETARNRMEAVCEIETLERGGLGRTAAIRRAAASHGVATSTLCNWLSRLNGVDRADRLAVLAPGHKGATDRADCHPDAWAALKSDFLRPERPSFSACYRRMVKAAKKHGWCPVPSERALRRHLRADVAPEAIALAREGRDKAKTLYPAQRRTRGHLHAMQAVNTDGHKLDVFVRMDDGRVTRVHLVAIQDLYSGKILSWRLSDSENKETVRLVIGDMVERYGIPDAIYLDNGRAFASKWITGGTPNRYRFKVRDEDPRGLLTTLGVEIHWTTPYSGQSKPIERAFRDLADAIAKHPACAGAYTGNRPDAKPENYGKAAIALEVLRALVASEIDEHNARPGRRAANLGGNSFDQAFTESIEKPSTIVRWPTAAQRALWLMAAESIRARKGNGELHLFGNRYWSPEMTAHAGKPVTVRFDPDHLTRDLHVYDALDRLICRAACVADTGFDDVEAARSHAGKRNRYLKAVREQQRMHAELTAAELARLYADARPQPDPPVQRPKVTRIAAAGGGAAAASEAAADWDERAETSFSKALRLIEGGRDE